jgi:origin recognition complex subunit 1
MTKGALVHEDSDDELGDEDHPWDWIYATEETEVKEDPETSNASPAKSRRRRSSRPAKKGPAIVGARMGSFECTLGEVVLLKSPENGKDWVGIITEFLEEEDEDEEGEAIKSVNVMWFASPDEFMSTRNKRRTDALPNEQYLTADFNVNPVTSINGKATVMSKDAFYAKYPNGVPPKDKAERVEFNKCIVCRRGVNQVQGRYTDEFNWEEVYGERNIHQLISMVKEGLKAARKRKAADDDVSLPLLVQADHPHQHELTTSAVCRYQGRDCRSIHSEETAKNGCDQCDPEITAQEGFDDTFKQAVCKHIIPTPVYQ